MWIPESDAVDGQLVQRSVTRLSLEILTAAVATCDVERPYVCTAYFALRGNRLWFTSQDSTRHVANIRSRPEVAIALWKAPAEWGEALRGLQLAGKGVEATTETEAAMGLEALHEKFPGTRGTLPDISAVLGPTKRTCLFCVNSYGGTLRDENALGKGKFGILWRADDE